MKQPDTYCLSLLTIVLRKPLRILKSKKWEKWERQQPLIIVEIHQPSNLTKYYTKILPKKKKYIIRRRMILHES